jgi:Glycosyltransferase
MIYSFHHFYYWLKGGVETGQAYRAKLLRNIGLDAKFIFATTFPLNNIQQETEYLGFLDSEVIWLYGFFTNCRLSPVTYTLGQLERGFEERIFSFSRDGAVVRYNFPEANNYYVAYMTDNTSDCVHRVEMISNGCMVRKDYYTYCRIYSEYYIPLDGQANLYLRRFFDEDGTVAYEELIDGDAVLYKFPDRLIYSREELVGYMMSCLKLTKDDVVLIDGEPGMIDRSAFIVNAAPAKVGFVIHADHFLQSDEEHILWYGIYEYAFSHPEKISFYVTSTEVQSELLREQFRRYKGVEPEVVTIPVMGLDKLRIPESPRRKHSLISVGRLAPEKKMDQVIEAVVAAKESVHDLSLDIYGEGREEEKLRELIEKLDCWDYVHLCGFQKLDEVYQQYEAYLSASYVETFGVTLLEAIGSGLPIISYDIRYGAQIFVDEGKNGYKVPWGDVEGLAQGIVRLFTETDLEAFRQHSYEKAQGYFTQEVENKWRELLS